FSEESQWCRRLKRQRTKRRAGRRAGRIGSRRTTLPLIQGNSKAGKYRGGFFVIVRPRATRLHSKPSWTPAALRTMDVARPEQSAWLTSSTALARSARSAGVRGCERPAAMYFLRDRRECYDSPKPIVFARLSLIRLTLRSSCR